MIPFLVKLANLLDTRGQHSMAREVDDLIEKLAQATTWSDSWVADNKKLKGLFANLKELAALSGNKRISQILDSSIQWVDALSKDKLTDETINQGNEWWDYLGKNVFKPLEAAIQGGQMSGDRYYQIKEQMTPILNDIAKYSGQARDQVANQEPEWLKRPQQAGKPAEQTGNANKAPAKKPSIISLVQKAVGAPEVNGKWDPATNKAFVAYMNKNWPLAMKDNVFVGLVVDDKGTRSGNKLADAWSLISKGQVASKRAPEMYGHELGPEKTQPGSAPQDVASKAPARPATAPITNWKSKWHKMTPAAQGYLARIEKESPGAGQGYINTIDGVPSQTQADFEDALKDVAESMEDKSGKGRLNETYRRGPAQQAQKPRFNAPAAGLPAQEDDNEIPGQPRKKV